MIPLELQPPFSAPARLPVPGRDFALRPLPPRRLRSFLCCCALDAMAPRGAAVGPQRSGHSREGTQETLLPSCPRSFPVPTVHSLVDPYGFLFLSSAQPHAQKCRAHAQWDAAPREVEVSLPTARRTAEPRRLRSQALCRVEKTKPTNQTKKKPLLLLPPTFP